MAEVAKDPAADFLAREQSALGDLDEDFAFPETKGEAVSGNESSDNDAPAQNMVNGISNGVSQLSLNGNSSGPSSVPSIPFEEPESIKKWREEHKKAIEAKDIAEKEAIEALRAEAKKELESWYEQYAAQLEKTKQQNRACSMAAEKDWIAERDAAEQGGSQQDWEKIAKLCDLTQKSNHNAKDTSRMKSILLQLKQSPPPMPSQ